MGAKPSGKGKGRPKKAFNPASSFKTAATGETRNSPMTSPNIIFWLGIGLIAFSGYSNGRIPRIFSFAFNGPNSKLEPDAKSWLNDLKVFASQFLFLFILVISARAIPPLSRIWLVIVGGLWLLYIMKNPQVVQLLNWTSQGNSAPSLPWNANNSTTSPAGLPFNTTNAVNGVVAQIGKSATQ